MSATILIVDDHPLILEALEAHLRKTRDLRVVGRATSGEEALEQVRRLRPDLVLMDLKMPGIGGLEAIRRLKAEFPATAVVVLTAAETRERLLECVVAGAAGYLTKGCQPSLLLDSLRTVLGGGTTLPSELLRDSVQHLRRGQPVEPQSATELTERELEVLQMVAQGCSNRVISETLRIVEATVKKHVHNIIHKLGVSDRTQAAVAGIRNGLVPGEMRA